ncbi:hypothetical protein EIN_178750 [Entamoeba invadens IP1]|uniref:hypothetical protein n=1 Tax=Entamoeba invadens IP1 TaxID=370355 RepID=UPI0002C3D030|nr:hypothetical protein EIN_178750 [Entamoeba invadens IP1]ELP93918.1 hypothetical protein EIN_178750 [Entamoeba invadens IP1]|eukprot:XP_004260689.1 hypothetical protein EIN_178750 [Entamoeba invadens IP1]
MFKMMGELSNYFRSKKDRSPSPSTDDTEQTKVVLKILKDEYNVEERLTTLIEKNFVGVIQENPCCCPNSRILYWSLSGATREIISILVALYKQSDINEKVVKGILFGVSSFTAPQALFYSNIILSLDKMKEPIGEPTYDMNGKIITLTPKSLFYCAINEIEGDKIMNLFLFSFRFWDDEKVVLEWCEEEYTHCVVEWELGEGVKDYLGRIENIMLHVLKYSKMKDEVLKDYVEKYVNDSRFSKYFISRLNEEFYQKNTNSDVPIKEKKKKRKERRYISQSEEPETAFINDEKEIVIVHKNNLMEIHPKIVAQQMAIFDEWNFHQIDVKSFVFNENNEQVNLYNRRIQSVLQMVKALLVDSKAMKYFIQVVEYFVEMKEYNLGFEMMKVIDSVLETKPTENMCGSDIQSDWEQIHQLFSHYKNYKMYRIDLSEVPVGVPRIPIIQVWIEDTKSVELSSIFNCEQKTIDMSLLVEVSKTVSTLIHSQRVSFPFTSNSCFQFYFNSLL